MQKTEPLVKFGDHFGQLRHSLSGGVTLKAQQNAVCVRVSPLTTCPMFIDNFPLRLKVIPHSCLLQRSVTRQDDVQSDVRTQLIQAVKHPYSIFQGLNIVSNDFLPFHTTFQERLCFRCRA